MRTDEEIELFVPGRLCIFGEHSDWAGRFSDMNAEVLPGRAIVTGINLGIHAVVSPSDRFSMTSFDENGDELCFSCAMELATLKQYAREPQFFSYACGVAAYILEHYQVGGVSIAVTEVTLPIKKGLSSSAATCVLVTRAFNEIYHLRMSTNGEMQAAYRGELLTASRCGRLDQACAYGTRAVLMEFSGNDVSADKLRIGGDFYWVFADLGAGKDTKKILSDLNSAFPFAQTKKDARVHEALGADNYAIIDEAVALFAAGDAEKLGLLMTRAQKLFDDKIAPSSTELAAPRLHAVLADETVKSLTFGGKGVGSQGDGTVQLIARDKGSQQTLTDYLRGKLGLTAYPFFIPASDRVRRAIIPLAGFGTRMYPATRFVRKDMLPVVDENGIAKPVLMYLLEELDEAEIEEIILVVGAGDLEQYERMFEPLTDEHMCKLPERVIDYEKLIARIAKKIRFAVQESRRGFGHAVYQARELLDGEPALLLLGDFIYKSNLNLTCTRQTINAYRKSGGQLTVSIRETPLRDVVHYGVLAGSFDGKRSYLMTVREMAEKPSVEYARDYLAVRCGNQKDRYYSTFGQYVLTPDVFEHLAADIAEHDRTGDPSEIQLTGALQKVLDEKGMTGVLVDGTSYDVGIPEAYKRTMVAFGVSGRPFPRADTPFLLSRQTDLSRSRL